MIYIKKSSLIITALQEIQGELDPPAHRCEGFNPLCGDEVIVFVSLIDQKIEDIRIGGQGCSISQASASMMTEIIKGKSISEAEK